MHALIVHAHPEPTSFNAALTDVAVRTLTAQDMTVDVSDLYAEGFDPVLSRADFASVADAARFDAVKEQVHAANGGGFGPMVAREMERLHRTDLVILQFPLWWFSVPAILKGWVDRVFAAGVAYGQGKGIYGTGGLAGKRAMCSVTTGGPEQVLSPGGLNGDLDMLLFHVENGMLWFCGMEVLPRFTAFGVARASDAERSAHLAAYATRLAAWRTTPPVRFEQGRRIA